MQRLHGLDILLTGLVGISSRVVKFASDEELRCGVGVGSSTTRSDSFDNFRIELSATDGLHHGQMLEVVMRLEECIASKELDKDAAYAPDIAWKGPAELQNDFRSAIMSRRYYR